MPPRCERDAAAGIHGGRVRAGAQRPEARQSSDPQIVEERKITGVDLA
jgi:hypothetical protein